jgi:hypothetical protein
METPGYAEGGRPPNTGLPPSFPTRSRVGDHYSLEEVPGVCAESSLGKHGQAGTRVGQPRRAHRRLSTVGGHRFKWADVRAWLESER